MTRTDPTTGMHAAKQLLRAALLAGCLSAAGCATRLHAIAARVSEPRYLVTRDFYTEAPQRVAVLPFATRTATEADARKAEVCRRTFYKHLSVRDYEHLGLRQFDRSLFANAGTNHASLLRQLVDVVHQLDVVGMTTVVDLQSLFGPESLAYPEFFDMLRITRDELHADAEVVGITRSFGRFYAGVLSSIGLSTRVELRSATTGNLLWRGEQRKRSFEVPLTLNLLDVPHRLFDVWRSSRGLALDTLAYQVYGDLVRTMPYVPQAGAAFVEVTHPDAPYFKEPTLWMLFPQGRAQTGQRHPFQQERGGWYACDMPDGATVWFFRDHVRIVDANGRLIDARADLRW